jgi:hypothetical protein
MVPLSNDNDKKTSIVCQGHWSRLYQLIGNLGRQNTDRTTCIEPTTSSLVHKWGHLLFLKVRGHIHNSEGKSFRQDTINP